MAKLNRLFRILAAVAISLGLIAAVPSTGKVIANRFTRALPALNGSSALSPLVAGDEIWSRQFALGANNWIYTIASAPNGDIYVAGDFTQIAGVSASHVAHWSANPGQWSSQNRPQ
jgi:hypothetical protein